jgi:cyanate permease
MIDWVIELYGWRQTCWILAGVVGGGMSLIAWVFFRDNPEQCGLVMDGIDDPEWLAEQEKKAPETKIEFTRRQALKKWAFWAFSLGLACYGLVITGIMFHLTAIGEEMGRTRKETLNVFIVMSFVGITTRFIASWLTDRTKLKLKWLLLVMMAAQILGTVGVLKFADNTGWGMTALGYGITGGIWGIIFSVALPRFFGREHLGAISGLTMSICVLASAVGPWLFSRGHSLTGDYRAVIGLSMLIPVAIIFMALKAENPQRNR